MYYFQSDTDYLNEQFRATRMYMYVYLYVYVHVYVCVCISDNVNQLHLIIALLLQQMKF